MGQSFEWLHNDLLERMKLDAEAIGATSRFYFPRADVVTQDPVDLLAPLLQRIAGLAKRQRRHVGPQKLRRC